MQLCRRWDVDPRKLAAIEDTKQCSRITMIGISASPRSAMLQYECHLNTNLVSPREAVRMSCSMEMLVAGMEIGRGNRDAHLYQARALACYMQDWGVCST